MSRGERPLFIIDVDWTITDCGEPRRIRPGMRQLLGVLSVAGEVHAWSAGGQAHVREVIDEFKLGEYIVAAHDKPPYPPREEEALAILGRKPMLQLDDDLSEQIADWPFIALNSFTPESDGNVIDLDGYRP